jgi:hypothetical protein
MNKEQNAALEAERVAAESWYEEYAAKGWSVSKIATTTAFKAGIEYARAQLAAPDNAALLREVECLKSAVLVSQRSAVAISKELRAQLAAPAGVAEGVFCFEYQHVFNKEKRTVCITRKEVAEGMEDTLFDKLSEQICQCEPVGETNVVDCNCCDYAEDFDLLADAPPPAPEHVEKRTTGDKYRAELYDEVWQKARDMGYGNVTEALIALERLKPASDVVPVPRELQDEAERCAFALENIGSMDAEDIDGDAIDLRFEDADGRDTGCDVSIVEYAERAANVIRALLNGGRV